MNTQSPIDGFRRQFGQAPERTYVSPGRVNLIGEYTDFNGGHVLPAAIDLGTYFAVRPNKTRAVNIFSEAPGEVASVPLDEPGHLEARDHWSDYACGIVVELHRRDVHGDGVDIYVSNDLPQNVGLSSSASFTTGLACLLDDVWDGHLDRVTLAQVAQNAENHFVGVRCGIMDPFAVAMGKTDHCTHLHCQSLDYELVPLNIGGHEIVVTDSQVPRRLASTAYNARRAECEGALECLQHDHAVRHLCDIRLEDIEACDDLLAKPVPYRRARHVVAEDERVRQSVNALKQGDVRKFGQLMQASHRSLRDDFEVSCPELDLLVDTAMSIDGVAGSRMTGAGFGGCTVSIIETNAVDDFVRRIRETYANETPYEARILRCRAADGVRRLD